MVGTIASNVYKRGVIFGTLTSLAILKRIFYKTDVLQYIYLLISMSICFYIIVYTYTHNSHICTYHWNLRSPIVDLGNQKKHGAAWHNPEMPTMSLGSAPSSWQRQWKKLCSYGVSPFHRETMDLVSSFFWPNIPSLIGINVPIKIDSEKNHRGIHKALSSWSPTEVSTGLLGDSQIAKAWPQVAKAGSEKGS